MSCSSTLAFGMLRDEARPQQFQPLASNLFHGGRVIEEPPAAEGHEIVELSRIDAEFMLILTAENAHQKTIVRITAAQIFERSKVCSAHTVAGQSKPGIDLTAHANHQRQAQF